ncbi:MAG: hypothetical protein JO287_14360 [Pseudonocardiales bacterium]|nr:hypothetical protein [Pseudonocardiales bacterium]
MDDSSCAYMIARYDDPIEVSVRSGHVDITIGEASWGCEYRLSMPTAAVSAFCARVHAAMFADDTESAPGVHLNDGLACFRAHLEDGATVVAGATNRGIALRIGPIGLTLSRSQTVELLAKLIA